MEARLSLLCWKIQSRGFPCAPLLRNGCMVSHSEILLPFRSDEYKFISPVIRYGFEPAEKTALTGERNGDFRFSIRDMCCC